MRFDVLQMEYPNVSRETYEALSQLVILLNKWNRAINLVAANSVADAWQRHVLDSLQLWQYISPNAHRLTDIGSGAGFPGLVLAIAAQTTEHQLRVTLIESDHRKCEFLNTVTRILGLDVAVIADQIIQVPAQFADVLTARALAPLDVLLGYADLHLAPHGIALFLKGENAMAEVKVARERWEFQLESYGSLTNPTGNVFKIGDIRRV